MKRVHPEFMNFDFDSADGFVESMIELPKNIKKGLEYWTNTISMEIGTIAPAETPLIIAALRELADSYAENVPDSGEVADDLRSLITSRKYVVVKVPR